MNFIQETISSHVNQYGLAIQCVYPTAEEDVPFFMYTIGMTNIGAAEVIVFGLIPDIMMDVINELYVDIKEGRVDKKTEIFNDMLSVPVLSHVVDKKSASEYGVQAFEYYKQRGMTPTFRQLIWPDANGVYPHQEGCSERIRQVQPYIGNKSKSKKLGIDLDGPGI
jgi:hypothetical protein